MKMLRSINSGLVLGAAISLVLALRITLHQAQVPWYWLLVSVLIEAVLGYMVGRHYANRFFYS